MEDNNNNICSGLQRLIDSLSYNRSIHISIHYLYGFFKNDEVLNINHRNQFHSCDYCMMIKSVKAGKTKCMKTKSIAVSRALKLARLYYGRCYMGVTEIVLPVYFNDQPIAVIFLGYLSYNDDRQEQLPLIETNLNKFGLDASMILSHYCKLENINKNEIDHYIKMAQSISDFIASYMNSNFNKYKTLVFDTKKKKNFIISKVVSHLENHYFADIKLDEVAKLYFINPQYLSRLFKNTIGISFSEYLCNTRIEHAKLYLTETDEKIITIAFKSGFNSINYFNSIFKKKTGMTPMEYRSMNNK